MQLYGLKNCDTCRKAIKMLGNVEFVDVRAQGVPNEILVAANNQFGAALVNTRSTTWRGLSDEERNADPMKLLKEHPTLMKRPLIVEGANMYLGWTSEVKAALGIS